MPGYADPLTHLAAYLAAIVHDYEHVGRTNDYLINSGDALALRYNDRAPLENHHLAAAFAVLRKWVGWCAAARALVAAVVAACTCVLHAVPNRNGGGPSPAPQPRSVQHAVQAAAPARMRHGPKGCVATDDAAPCLPD